MDLSTVLGVALAWLFVGTAIYLGADGKAAALIDPTSFLVVLGVVLGSWGGLGALLGGLGAVSVVTVPE